MSNAQRQSVTSSSNDWLTVEQAAVLCKESLRTWQRKAAWEQQRSDQCKRESMAVLAAPPGGKGKPVWWIKRTIDRRLTKHPSNAKRNQRDQVALYTKYAQDTVDLAYRKAHYLNQWEKRSLTMGRDNLTELQVAHQIVSEATRIEGPSFRISERTLKRWKSAYNAIGSNGHIVGVEGLIDRRGLPTDGDGGGSEGTTRDQAAVEYFYSVYRSENKLTARMCHDATLRAARKNRWRWPVSYASTTKWLRDTDDKSLTYLMRYGKDRWSHKFLSHLEIDYGLISPADLYVADHTQLDMWCEYKGKQIRPWLTAIQDCASRCIVGWHLGPNPHSDAIISTIRMACRDWAIPERMRIDNGKDYTSKIITGVTKSQRDSLRRSIGPEWQTWLKRNAGQDAPIDSRWLGICGELDIELIYAIPYAPWSKGTIERFFGRLHDQHDKTYATYCGNSALNKPECLEQIKRGYTDSQRRYLKKKHGNSWKRHAVLKLCDESDIPSLADVKQRVADWMESYHNLPHRGLSGQTPMAIWHTATSLKRAINDDLVCLLETRGLFKVHANGVGVTIGPVKINYGKMCAGLKRYVGRKVLISLDPDDISRCWAFDANNRKPIGDLQANTRIPPFTCADDAREAIAEQLKERRVMHQAARSSAKRTRTAAQRIVEHSQATHAELRKTGTDDVTITSIVPFQTGFEGVSKGDRTTFDPTTFDSLDDIEDLYMDEQELLAQDEDDDDQGMDDLFVDEEHLAVTDGDDDLESLL